MDSIVEEKIRQYRNFVTHKTEAPAATNTDKPPRETNLSRVIHSEEDAEMFIAQVNCLIRLSKKRQAK
ncbi:hypothetical protein [Chitinophaga pinensis]|uniref:Uncharacterized protein n=1 Tax=Chitinophaga pinensis (strain ATCC 43595 / DSM 2588 / LMG 13176 / NBRC 15968 / NCIMB 11800 / UQM 2034) TaxID=485918 RepID=A0A979GBG1_CHIPD|nr:hypothetical protein [Chitinophaga pinensis]ACU64150.1 hypothetical protein Cpin_6749 [Chitinophaga pinensis DSM 2588]